MIIIIHGSHRHGYHWEVTNLLKQHLLEYDFDIRIIDLSKSNINYCCGHQFCQEGNCIYSDDFTSIHMNQLLKADCIYIVAPTYFNMPSAKLKNFIDRTNSILPLIDNNSSSPLFGAWVSGEADFESIESNLNLLINYAEIMGWQVNKDVNNIVSLSEDKNIDKKIIEDITSIIKNHIK